MVEEGIAEGGQVVTGNDRAISRELEDGSKVVVEDEGAGASGRSG